MRLKSITLYGFKSFADKTTIDFEQGVTAIVGPNGCGKSNIVDSIKWVLGEQSAKSLRGDAMVDVIFNGTDNRKPLNYAEVTITFAQAGDFLPLETTEVEITRRLYRTGESEYMINRKVCRLKDIRDMFLDTGLGSSAYSIIEQGKVDFLLYASKDDRRQIFDESAGISKYKLRKRIALHKLEKVEQNLLRVTDIIKEVGKQLRSISYQASKARRYQTLSGEIREMKIVLFLSDYDMLQQEITRKSEEITSLTEQIDKVTADINVFQSDLEKEETAALDLDRELTKIQAQEMNLQSEAERVQKEIDWMREQINELAAREASCQEEIKTVAERTASMESQIGETQKLLSEYNAAFNEKDEMKKEHEEALAKLQSDWSARRGEVDSLKNELYERMKRRSRLEQELGGLRVERDVAHQRSGDIETRKKETGVQVALVHREITEIEEKRNQLKSGINTRETQLGENRALLSEVSNKVLDLRDKKAELQRVKDSMKSRFELLTDLDTRMEGISAGAHSVLSAAKTYREAAEQVSAVNETQDSSGQETQTETAPVQVADAWQRGVVGLVADLVDVPEKYALAFESLLGTKSQYIVTENGETAMQAVDYLRESRGGRATFMPLDKVNPQSVSFPELNNGTVKAIDVVSFDEKYRNVCEILFGNAVIVEDMSHALAISNDIKNRCDVVTLAGEILCSVGTISGGASKQESGLISRKSEMHALPAKIDEVKEKIAQISEELERHESEKDVLDNKIRELSDNIASERMALSREETRASEKEQEAGRLMALQAQLENNLKEALARLEVAERGVSEAEKNIETARTEDESLQEKVRASEQALQEIAVTRSDMEMKISGIKEELAGLRERVNSMQNRLEQSRSALAEYRESADKRRAEIGQIAQQRAKLTGSIEHSELELEKLFEERSTISQRINSVREKRDEVNKSLETRRIEDRAMKSRLAEMSERMNGLKLKESECRIKSDNITERLMSDFATNVLEMYPKFQRQKENIQIDNVRRELQSSEEKLASLGSINLEAIEEQSKLEERLNYLTEQEKDIQSARKQLLEIIDRINRVSRERFEQTFNAVRANFSEIFRKLFGGGKADVFLEEDKDILDAGVEIVARPPGKELKAISLLSGGEKVMTTIALLFALFRSRPTPFCILDEVDAPLDESNIDRFMAVLRGFLEDSQFVIITHSKRTTSLADIIYGITMQEVGISKVISVKLEELEEPQLVMSYELGV